MQGPTVDVHRHRKSGVFTIYPCARHFSTPQQFGIPTVLPPDVSDEELLRTILENLPKTETQKYDLALAPKYSDEEYRRILKEDQPIMVQQTNAGYELMPMKRMRNSFGSIEGMTRTVSRAEFEEHGGKIIRQLFESMP